MITRKFGYLHARVLVDAQRELENMEKRLRHFDRIDFESNPKALKSRDADEKRQAGDTRIALLQEINKKLRDYREFLVPSGRSSLMFVSR